MFMFKSIWQGVCVSVVNQRVISISPGEFLNTWNRLYLWKCLLVVTFVLILRWSYCTNGGGSKSLASGRTKALTWARTITGQAAKRNRFFQNFQSDIRYWLIWWQHHDHFIPLTPASLWPPPDMGLTIGAGASVWLRGLRREDTSGRSNILMTPVFVKFYLYSILVHCSRWTDHIVAR